MAKKKKKTIHTKPLIWFSLIAIALVNLAGIQQVSHAQDGTCLAAVRDGQQRLAQVRGVSITDVQRSEHGYADGPSQRPFAYQFVVTGRGAENVMTSPVFLNSISQDITTHCADVSMVQFGVDQTDWQVSYGLVTRNEAFQCIAAGNGLIPRWGETVCP